MRYLDLTEGYSPTVASPNEGARRFGVSLTRFEEHDRELSNDVNNYDYLDDQKGNGLRYRYMVGPKYYKFLQDMMPQINQAGWHLTATDKKRRNLWQLVFEPKLTARTPRTAVFWHLTPRQSVEVILSAGLQPKTSRHGFKYPQPRIYMIRNEKDAFMMANSFSGRDKNPIDYSVIKVDLRRAKGITLHVDPELSKVAVYTTQPIPSQYVSLAHETVPQPDWMKR